MPTINLGPKKAWDRTIVKAEYQAVYQDPRGKRLRAKKFVANTICEK